MYFPTSFSDFAEKHGLSNALILFMAVDKSGRGTIRTLRGIKSSTSINYDKLVLFVECLKDKTVTVR